MATVLSSARQRILLHNMSWRDYTRLLRVFASQRGVRLAYDRGALEIVSPLFEHETDGCFLARLICILTEELRLPCKSGGSTTLRRRRRQRGIEPDKCFWIAHESQVRQIRRLDLRRDPPPDLAVETDVTSSSLDKMAIYAALRVPEVWRLDQPVLTFQVLQADGSYAASNRSLALPLLTPTDVMGFLNLRGQLDETSVVCQFRDWVRQQQAGSSTPPLSP